jgi:hypothetical protein
MTCRDWTRTVDLMVRTWGPRVNEAARWRLVSELGTRPQLKSMTTRDAQGALLIAAKSRVSLRHPSFFYRGIHAMVDHASGRAYFGPVGTKTDKDRFAELEKRVAELEEKLDTVMRWTGLKQPSETSE